MATFVKHIIYSSTPQGDAYEHSADPLAQDGHFRPVQCPMLMQLQVERAREDSTTRLDMGMHLFEAPAKRRGSRMRSLLQLASPPLRHVQGTLAMVVERDFHRPLRGHCVWAATRARDEHQPS